MMAFNAADRKNIRAAEKQARREEREREVVVRTVMDTKSGRLWFYELLSVCHVFESSFALEPVAMAFKEGERNVGLQIVSDLMRACPDMYVLMMREANERHITSERRWSEEPDRGDSGSEPAADDAAEPATAEAD